MNIKRLLLKAKDVTVLDILSIVPMLVALLISPFFKKKYEKVWGICERRSEARDNGYHFFKYMTANHLEQPCIYAIDKKCNDYRKVASLGETVQYGSVHHWVLYLTCKYLISSQSFKPNGYVCTFFERLGLFHPKHVFLQHGITKDIADFLLARNRLVTYFIAGAKPEYEFMRKEFGYPEGTMQYTGFARFDALHDFHVKNNRILVMPTWRKWLRFKSETHADAQMDIQNSEYVSAWKSLLTSEELERMIDEYQLEVIVHPHPNMKNLLDLKSMVSTKIKIADINQEDIQELLKTSQLLITDYSSVFFDMVYMKKPVIFYQFDEEKYRKYHYQQGWFDYHNTLFGVSCKTSNEVIEILKNLISDNFQVSKEYLEEHSKTYPLFDTDNCKRIYEILQ